MTRVFITIDTEFSIGGAFTDPARLQPIGAQNVLCEVHGRSEGLGFMLDTFERHRVAATWFAEVMQGAYFGPEPMGELARRIHARGHDVQMHVHPVWTYFDAPDWQDRLRRIPPNDDIHGRDQATVAGWLQRGLEAFEHWRLPRPVALRTGNLMVDRTVYRAMGEVGLPLASNVARAVFEPGEAPLRLNAGIHRIEGITELPVLCYADLAFGGRTHLKALTITGSSLTETCCLLDRAQRHGVAAVVLLTHCHEFVKGDMRGALQADRVNQRRLDGLCRWLDERRDRFEIATMRDLAAQTALPASSDDPLLTVPIHMAAARMLHNRLNELNLVPRR